MVQIFNLVLYNFSILVHTFIFSLHILLCSIQVSSFQFYPIFNYVQFFILSILVQSYNFKQCPMLSYDWNLMNFRNLISYRFWIFIIFRRTSIWQKMPKKHKNQFYSHLVSKFIHFIVHIRSTHILMMVQVHTRWGTFDA